MADMPADIAALPFERALQELEQIVDQLERGSVPLEESINIYERGEWLKKRCEALLANAEARIEKINSRSRRQAEGHGEARRELIIANTAPRSRGVCDFGRRLVAFADVIPALEPTEDHVMAEPQTPPHASPANLAHYLHGIHFPASKALLKSDAKKNKAPADILKLIQELPAQEYHSMVEIMKAVGQVE